MQAKRDRGHRRVVSLPEAEDVGVGGGAVWARMPSFPFWPARRCNRAEEESVLASKPKGKPMVAVVFLGVRCDRGWVAESALQPFAPPNHEQLFSLPRFERNKDYRAAVVEAMRVNRTLGNMGNMGV
mmetsp:Transcript_14287/g.32072  ORF Transcript_14287/g.32072 Transcript_14287/m.32072 type:complete len:127 (+) Transcript_14287:26-406(+)